MTSMRSARFPHVFVAFAACVAACAPSTFDNLTGAKPAEENPNVHAAEFNPSDPSLDGKDPRPIAPFSAASVNTSRPRFRWDLQAGTNGAMLELSRTRDFKEVFRRIPVTGSDHVMTEDLEKGVWFWRLQARNANGQGTTYSVTWQVLVRGQSARAASDVARGGIVDLDGDGIAELLVTAVGMHESGPPPAPLKPYSDILILFGSESSPGVINYDPANHGLAEVGEEKPSLVAGLDADGDGFGDFVVGTVFPAQPPMQPAAESELYTYFGGPEGYSTTERNEDEYYLGARDFTTLPALAAGDFNGDGYGDVSAMFQDFGSAFLGGKQGLASMLTFTGTSKAPATPVWSPVGASDLDGDGISDLAFAPFDTPTPLQVVKGATARFSFWSNVATTNAVEFPMPNRAIAMATGDFDGDAIEEIAFSTVIPDKAGDKAAVCIHSLLKPALNKFGCWISDLPVAGFGLTLKAADLNEDGRDELLVGSTGGIVALAHKGDGYDTVESTFEPTPIPGPYSPNLTVIHPGRPGKARWAVLGTDPNDATKTLVFIHEGIPAGPGETSVKQTLDFSKVNKSVYDFVRTGSTIR